MKVTRRTIYLCDFNIQGLEKVQKPKVINFSGDNVFCLFRCALALRYTKTGIRK